MPMVREWGLNTQISPARKSVGASLTAAGRSLQGSQNHKEEPLGAGLCVLALVYTHDLEVGSEESSQVLLTEKVGVAAIP